MQINRIFSSLVVCLVLTLLVGVAIKAGDKKAEKPTNPALAQFFENTKAHLELRQKIEKTLPPLKDKENAEEITAHQQTLRLKLAAARNGATQGSMFTPEGGRVLKQIINSEMRGPGGKTARTTVMESSPKAIPCKINAPYPSTEPVSTVPPDLLMKLPELPDNLEYRFVQENLILRDAKANMIIDCLPNAFSPPGGKTKPLASDSQTKKNREIKAEKKTDDKTEKKTE